MSAKKRVVIDTSILVSAVLNDLGVPAKAVEKAVDDFQIIASSAVFCEYIAVLSRDKFDAYVSIARRDAFLADIRMNIQMMVTEPQFSVCRDANDNKFLDLAVQGKAEYIITGDDDLLSLHPFCGVGIVTAADFILALS